MLLVRTGSPPSDPAGPAVIGLIAIQPAGGLRFAARSPRAWGLRGSVAARSKAKADRICGPSGVEPKLG